MNIYFDDLFGDLEQSDHSLVEQSQGVGDIVLVTLAYLCGHLFDCFVLKTHTNQNGLPSIVEILDAQLALEIELSKSRNQVNDQVIVRLIVGI
jgi:hypothetical protein